MNLFNEELKSALLGSLPEESRLSQLERQQIRDKVYALKGKKRRKSLNLFPKLMTAVVFTTLLFVTTGLVGTELGFFGSGSGSQDVPFYKGLEKGDRVGNWELTYKGLADADHEGLMEAHFEGRALLSGNLVYLEDEEQRMVFIPDQKSASLLPVNNSTLDELTFKMGEQMLLANIYGLKPGSKLEKAEFEIKGYTAYMKQEENVADVIHLDIESLPPEPEHIYTDWSILKGKNGELVLEDPLLKVYNQYSETRDDSLLATLEPFSIFMLYFYAEERSDYRIQYGLYDDNPEIFKPFASLEEYIKESEKAINKEGKKQLLQKIRSTSVMTEEIIGDREAVIWISKEEGHRQGFPLTRDGKGIWKINWMPVH
ncbi:hypothetical protein ACFSO7_13835 [Bacillus sp. CGMCC 1.16607]|uniref:hypothetical protein n=1 Tax=Bacillus sp. CGMCC 1.16607 TaxID=3351842 RepID=UPI00363C248D